MDNVGIELDSRFPAALSSKFSVAMKKPQPKTAEKEVAEGRGRGRGNGGGKYMVPYSCCSDLLNCTTRKHWLKIENKV